jgi:integrase
MNMVRRTGKPGYWFVRKVAGKKSTQYLGTDFASALDRYRSLKTQDVLLAEVTVSEAAKRWLSTYIATSRSPKGQLLTELRVQKYLESINHLLVSRLTTDDLRKYRLKLEAMTYQRKGDPEPRTISPQTVAHVLSDVRCLLRWCETAKLLSKSPFPRRLLPRIQERPPDRLTEEQIRIVCSLPEPRGFVCRLALETGLRWSELTRAKASDVERGFLVVHNTKSGKVRRVPLSPEFQAELRKRIGRLVPFSENASNSFNRTIREVPGLETFHAHQLRHTMACVWLEQGGSLAALQHVLGHASIVTTQRYARLTDDSVMAEKLKMSQRGDRRGDQKQKNKQVPARTKAS